MATGLLGGCAGIAPEKRHSPTELASYTVDNFAAPIASVVGEQSAHAEAIAKIRAAIALSSLAVGENAGLNPETPDALAAIALFNTQQDTGKLLVLDALAVFERDLQPASTEYQRAVIAGAYMFIPQEAAESLKRLMPKLGTPREFAMAAYAVLKATRASNQINGGASDETRQWLRQTLLNRYPDWANEPRLRALEHVLTTDVATEIAQRPPLGDLLAAPLRKLGPSLPVIYSFQRKDRQRYGLAMVRGPDGKFVRNADGSYFNIPHLAMALTNLPGTITNGNTPQGLFTIIGAGTATNKWIGPTPYLHSKIPVEATVAEFEHADLIQSSELWTEARYESFLPRSWQKYQPFKEAFLAGQAGRDDMLLHGTTINSEYYRGASFYPGTPSAGCLVAPEMWSKTDGVLLRSDQLSLAKAFTASGVDRGYLVVVELDDRPLPVTLADVVRDVVDAEIKMKAAAVLLPVSGSTASDVEKNIISVQQWGGTPVDAARAENAAKHTITKITLHHQGESFLYSRDARQYLRDLQAWSRHTRRWLDIPYHYVIDLDGNIYEGRDIHFVGDTNTDYDPRGHALIEVVGNFEEVEPNQAQLDAVVKTMTMLAAKYNISPEMINGHKNFSEQTVCPGKNLYRYLENGYFQERVRAGLAPNGMKPSNG